MKKNNYIVANWKMNGAWAANAELFKSIKEFSQLQKQIAPHTNVVICPPHPYLVQAKGLLNQSAIAFGAYTGDVSAEMLIDLEASYAIIGHSERRQFQNESNLQIANKLNQLIHRAILPIICIGESLETRQAQGTLAFIDQQLQPITNILTQAKAAGTLKTAVLIAYEPIWAIGTGLTANLEQVDEVCTHIQKALTPIGISHFVLYGGSVKANNAQSLMTLESVDGFLVGGASLIADEFKAIIASAA
jgi:triosephosphate isomerase (TIM)